MEYLYYRMFVYLLTIILHIGNFIYMALFIKPKMVHPDLYILRDLQSRFFTIWTVVLQLIYSMVGLTTDVLSIIKNGDEKNKTNKYLLGFRDTLFAGILWPSCWVVCLVFWSLSLYDKSLIFPEHTDNLLNPVSNHIMHTLIIPIAFWEIMFRARNLPRTHTKYFSHMVFYFAVYFVVLAYTFIDTGIWIYPIFAKLYGTIYFPLIHMAISGIAISAYFLQWPLTNYIWRERNVKKLK